MTAPEPPKTVEVTQSRIACDGGDGALGHPRVWLTLGPDGTVDCGYCGTRYVRAAGAGGH